MSLALVSCLARSSHTRLKLRIRHQSNAHGSLTVGLICETIPEFNQLIQVSGHTQKPTVVSSFLEKNISEPNTKICRFEVYITSMEVQTYNRSSPDATLSVSINSIESVCNDRIWKFEISTLHISEIMSNM